MVGRFGGGADNYRNQVLPVFHCCVCFPPASAGVFSRGVAHVFARRSARRPDCRLCLQQRAQGTAVQAGQARSHVCPPRAQLHPCPALQLNATTNSQGALDFFLSFPISAIKTSLMTLTVAADDVQFVVARSPATVEGVQAGPAVHALPADPAGLFLLAGRLCCRACCACRAPAWQIGAGWEAEG